MFNYEKVSPVCMFVYCGIPRFLLQQRDRAQSWLRNAEWRKRRVSTPLLLPQPKAGMQEGAGRDTVHPGRWDAQDARSHAYHPPQRIPFAVRH